MQRAPSRETGPEVSRGDMVALAQVNLGDIRKLTLLAGLGAELGGGHRLHNIYCGGDKEEA